MNYVSFQHKQVEAKINLFVSVKYFEKCHTHTPQPKNSPIWLGILPNILLSSA